jgi:pyruvate formate-lyase activating enzyme-like uncharacterized protein
VKKRKVIESRQESFYIKGRGIPKGCQLCLQGKKTVLFLNGLCQNPQHCFWYCPISEERKNKNLSFANEIPLINKSDLIQEINTSRSSGISITGGDPLLGANIKKTIEYIRYAKQERGKRFHIHLYTNGLNFNENIAQKLADAGLDEIRFNPPRELWNNIKFALNKGMKVGAEVPAIPDDMNIRQLEEFIYFLDKIRADFININEFEYCMPNSEYLKERGYTLQNGSIASVKNSKEVALDLVQRVADKVHLKIHLCTVITKDFWQLSMRYNRRAKSIKKSFEEITEEGLLIFASVEGNDQLLKLIKKYFIIDMKLPQKLFEVRNNEINFPIDIALSIKFQEFASKHGLKVNIVETTPFMETKYRQITEKTPLEVFKVELGIK